MNRKKLLAIARANGYTGDADLAKVKAFITENNIEIVGADGKALDIDAAWGKAHKVTAEDDESDPGDTDASQQDDADPEARVKALEKENADLRVKANRGSGYGRGPGPVNGAEDGGRLAIIDKTNRKNYERKIKDGKAHFADADHAEHFGALARLAVAQVNRLEYSQKDNDLAIVGKTAVTTNNTNAGFLIPPEYVASLIYLTENYGVARKLANVVPMSRDVKQQPRKTAIVAMAHVGENTTIGTQNNSYDLVELVAKKIAGLSKVSSEMLDDGAVNIADDLATSYAEGYAKRQDEDYFLGDGTATYGGHKGLATALPAGAYINASGNSWAGVVAADIYKALGSCQNIDRARMAIVCSFQFYMQRLRSLQTAVNQFKDLTGPGIRGSDASWDGFPVYFSQTLPIASAATSKFMYVGDFQAGSMIGERRDLTIAASDAPGFAEDVLTYRATARMAINVHGDGRGSTFGPIVGLVTT